MAYSTTGPNIFPGAGVSAPTNFSALGSAGATGFAFGNFGNAANLANVLNSQTNGIGVDMNLNGGFSLDSTGTIAVTNDITGTHSLIIGGSNSITLEALINVTATNAIQEIICSDNTGATAARGFQFRLNGANIEFNYIGSTPAGFTTPIPSAGAHAFVANSWFHVALTHKEVPVAGGTNTIIYWTALADSSPAANPVFTNTIETVDLTDPLTLVIGNEARSAGTSLGSAEGLLGLIDEVRISKVARAASELMFTNPVVFISSGPTPTNQIVAVGQPASFSVVVGGPSPRIRWQTNSVDIGGGATNATYSIAAATLADAGNYRVIVTNNNSGATSSVVTLTVRASVQNLTWAPPSSGFWNTADLNWDSNNDAASDTNYIPGDVVRFDDVGLGSPTVDLTGTLTPSSVTVSNTAGDYILTTSSSGSISSTAQLVKDGASALSVDTDNSNTGGTVITAGTVNVGVGGVRGSLGSGPIANSGVLVFNRASALTVPGNLSGNGSLTFNGNANITLSGSNSYTADTLVNAGVLTLASTNALGASTNVVVTSTTGGALGGTRIALNAGVVVGGNVALALPTAGTTVRSCLFAGGASSWNGPITITGDGAASPSDQIAFASSGGFMTIGGAVTGVTFPGTLQLRGDGTGSGSAANIVNGFGGTLNSTLNLGSGATLQVHDGTTWTINSTGNNWLISEIAKGTLKLTQNNAMPTGVTVRMGAVGNAWLDLAGVNQQIAGLAVVGNVGVITNSSATTDSTLTVNTNAGANLYTGTIVDGATRKTSLVNADGTLILNGVNTYSGNTTVSAGTLALTNSGSIGNSANIDVVAGATLDVSGNTNGGLTLGAAQTLKGNGTILGSVLASGTIAPGASIGTLTFSNNLALNGSLAIEVNTSVSPTNDYLIVSGVLTNAGTGLVNVSNLGPALVAGNSFKLFSQPVLNGGALTITNGIGAGLAWTNLLAVDGSIAVISTGPSYATNATNLTFTAGGGSLNISWPSDHLGWILQSQTNSRAIGLTSGWIDMAGTASITATNLPVSIADPTVFYRLRIP